MEALGINITSMTIYVILFILVFIIIKRTFLGKLMDILEKRREDALSSIEKIKEADKQLKNIDVKKEELADQSKIDSKKALTEATNKAKIERKEILDNAKTEADQIISKANKRLEQERAKMEEDFQSKVEEATKKAVREIYMQNKLDFDKKLIDEVIGGL